MRVARVTVRLAFRSVTSFNDETVKPYFSAHLTCDQCWKHSASDTEQCTVRAHFAIFIRFCSKRTLQEVCVHTTLEARPNACADTTNLFSCRGLRGNRISRFFFSLLIRIRRLHSGRQEDEEGEALQERCSEWHKQSQYTTPIQWATVRRGRRSFPGLKSSSH